MGITNEGTMNQMQAIRQRIATLREHNRIVQAIHPEVATVKIFGMVKQQMNLLTLQLVGELYLQLTDIEATEAEVCLTE